MDAVLQTKRLLLRRARLSDRDAYLELRNNPYVMDCNPMASITPEQAERQLEKDQASGRAFYLEERATGLLARAVRCPGGQVHDDVPFSLLRQEWEASQRG